jgi:NADH dehydrogenase
VTATSPERVVVVGGTGRLGQRVVALLLASGRTVRVVARSSAAALPPGAEFMAADVTRRDSLPPALRDATVVVSAMHGMDPTSGQSPRSVDRDGNIDLIKAARAVGARMVLVSVIGASPDHPLELHRMKYAAEQALRAGPPDWTIVRGSAYVEMWAELLAQTAQRSGRPTVFGHGENPINFVSVQDVATAVARAATDQTLDGHIIEVGGPENLTLNEIASRVAGGAPPRHIPPIALKAMALLAAPVRPAQARLARTALLMDQADLTFDSAASKAAHPWLGQTNVTGAITAPAAE